MERGLKGKISRSKEGKKRKNKSKWKDKGGKGRKSGLCFISLL